MSTNSKQKNNLLNVTMIGLFAALCYISLMLFFFPFGQMFIHFGNLIVVTAALLIGGWQGGLAGSIGMGLYDLFNGHADSSPKTFLLKFLIGLTVGVVYSIFKNRKKYPTATLLISGFASLVLGLGIMLFNTIKGNKMEFDLIVLFSLFIVIGVFCLIFALLGKKLSQKTAAATVGAAAGMLINIIGETLWKTVQFSLAGSNVSAAFTTAALAQGSTLINAAISIIGGVILFVALEKPFNKIISK